MTDTYDWNDLALQAESGQLLPVKGSELRGESAAQSCRGALLQATGADTMEEAKHIALGRPRLDSQSSISVTWKVRASAQLDDIVDDIARREGRTRSALIRDAVAEYARTHQAV
jgi:hypothetical protein